MPTKLKRVAVLLPSPTSSARVRGHTVKRLIQAKEHPMLIVAGHLVVEPPQLASYLAECKLVVQQARRTPGCLDFAISADLADPGRINVFERWESQAAVDAFRGSGPSAEQQGLIVSASVCEYDVGDVRPLT
jgi:quinol monooxygenase YgiN